MCQAKPGNRCSAHARKALSRAAVAHRDNPTYETYDALRKAQDDYDTTPAGQESLREKVATATNPEERQRLSDRLHRGAHLHEQRAEAYREAQRAAERQEMIDRATREWEARLATPEGWAFDHALAREGDYGIPAVESILGDIHRSRTALMRHLYEGEVDNDGYITRDALEDVTDYTGITLTDVQVGVSDDHKPAVTFRYMATLDRATADAYLRDALDGTSYDHNDAADVADRLNAEQLADTERPQSQRNAEDRALIEVAHADEDDIVVSHEYEGHFTESIVYEYMQRHENGGW